MLKKAHLAEPAPAKINLALHVTGKRADGYHLLDSLVAFADVGDVLHMDWAEETSLEITGPFAHKLNAEDEENLVLRAVAGFRRLVPGVAPVRVVLEKHLPVSSGIGGGSADAAAALRGLMRLSGAAPERAAMMELALSLGADVPVCLHGRACRMRGIGEALGEAAGFEPVHALLANPGLACGTADVFRALDLRDGFAPMGDGFSRAALGGLRNDLQAPAVQCLPVIGHVLEALEALPGAWLSRMSGSGATCFALFDTPDAAVAAAAELSAAHPQWWVKPVRIG